MAPIFIDPSGWGHLVDLRQKLHPRATALYRAARQRGRTIVTTNHVLAELAALTVSPLRLPRATAIAFIRDLRSSHIVTSVHVGAELEEEAWRLWANRPDKMWSFVDCTSFVVMQRMAITDALTDDHHFVQAGFVALLR